MEKYFNDFNNLYKIQLNWAWGTSFLKRNQAPIVFFLFFFHIIRRTWGSNYLPYKIQFLNIRQDPSSAPSFTTHHKLILFILFVSSLTAKPYQLNTVQTQNDLIKDNVECLQEYTLVHPWCRCQQFFFGHIPFNINLHLVFH